jgi:hypothetical protein
VWLGGAISALLVLFTKNNPASAEELTTTIAILKLIENSLIIPGALGSFTTGFLMGLLTEWGFFKHRWVIFKWIATGIAMLNGGFLLDKSVIGMITVSNAQGLVAIHDSAYQSFYHTATTCGLINLSINLALFMVSFLKPWENKKADVGILGVLPGRSSDTTKNQV